MIDGWEYYAAKDLNNKAVPYPGKRPFPNALDPSDGKSGDGQRMGLRRRRPQELRGVPRVAADRQLVQCARPSAAPTLARRSATATARRLAAAARRRRCRPGKCFLRPLQPVGSPIPSTYNIHAGRRLARRRARRGRGRSLQLARVRARHRTRVLVGELVRLRGPRGRGMAQAGQRRPRPAPPSTSAPSASGPITELDMSDGDVDGDGAAGRRGRPGLRRRHRISSRSTSTSTISTPTVADLRDRDLPVARRDRA